MEQGVLIEKKGKAVNRTQPPNQDGLVSQVFERHSDKEEKNESESFQEGHSVERFWNLGHSFVV